MHRLKERLTFANVTASLALFIALGGTSYAAITLPRNSVGTNQLRTGAIRSVDVKDRSLEARDLSVKARRFLKGQKGERGDRGPAGDAGQSGQTTTNTGGGTTTTTSGPLAVTYASAGPTTVGAAGNNTSTVASDTANCGTGRRVVGGGVRVDTGGDVSTRESYPNLNNTAWTGVVGNDGDAGTFTVFAICVPTS
jgi:hypothetical protein